VAGGIKPFALHVAPLNVQGCPVDPTSPVPPPWDNQPSAGPAGSPASPVGTSTRVSEIGQMLAKWARNPALRPYEEIFRAEPNEAWFDPLRAPDNPTQFEIGSLQPGKGQSYVIMDYSVQPYGFSGLTPNDFDDLEDNRISGSFGYTLTRNGQAPGILRYFLDPVNSTIRQQSLQMSSKKNPLDFRALTADDFVRSAAAQYASAAGFGTAVHPQTAGRYGGRIMPFGDFCHEDEIMAVQGVVYRTIEVPLAFVQVRFSGFMLPSELAKTIERDLAVSMR